MYSWGVGEGGRLGLGDKGNHNSPRLVSFLGDINITIISAGASHSVAVSENGEVYSWGDGAFGKLGHGNEQAQTFPKLVAGLKGITITSISAGGKHTTAASEKGEIYVWGSDDAGQLGLGYQKTNQLTPKALPSLRGITIVQLSCGAQRSAALTDKGEVFTWGRGDHGRLGHGDTASQPLPKSVASLRGIPVIYISSGGGHNAALSVSGEVYCWGRGDSGQLGIGSKAHQNIPKLVQYLQGIRIIDISAGGYHTVAISDAGEMYTWGRGDYGVLGRGDEQNQLLPKIVPIGTEKMMRASAGFWHNLAINDAHELFSWGNGEGGKLGHGSEDSRNSPQRVESFRSMKVERLSAGETHSVVLAHEHRITKQATPFRPVLPQNYTASKNSAVPLPLHRSFPPSTPPATPRSTNLASSANAATSHTNEIPAATPPRNTVSQTTPPPTRQITPLASNNTTTPSDAQQITYARSFKAPQRRETPLPEDIVLSFQTHTDWFTCAKKLRDFVAVLENYSANATGTTTPANARRAAATKDKAYYSHFVDVDQAIKNYGITVSYHAEIALMYHIYHNREYQSGGGSAIQAKTASL